MKLSKQEELLSVFSIALVMIACSVLIFFERSPSLTGNAILQNDQVTTIGTVPVLILAGLAVVIGAIIVVHKITQEMKLHKQAVGEQKTHIGGQNVELATYVLKAKSQGFSDDVILQRLKQSSWNEKEIKKYLE